jgi:dihydroorotate dehydrogenase (NAD+) catalytic subunit
MTSSPSLGVEIGSLKLKNPFLAASGTCGYGVEIAHVVDLSSLGGIVTKGLYMAARDGCDVPRICETPAGLLNAIGLQGVGIRSFVEKVMPQLRAFDTAVIVNVCGETVEEYAEVSRIAKAALPSLAFTAARGCSRILRASPQAPVPTSNDHRRQR